MNCPRVIVVSEFSGSGAPTGSGAPLALTLMIPGNVLVNALAASVVRPSPGGPIAAPSRKCCQIGCVSQYKPAPPRITVFLSFPTAQAKPNCGAKSA